MLPAVAMVCCEVNNGTGWGVWHGSSRSEVAARAAGGGGGAVAAGAAAAPTASARPTAAAAHPGAAERLAQGCRGRQARVGCPGVGRSRCPGFSAAARLNERSHTSSDRQEGNWAAIALLTPAAAAHRAQRCVRPSAEVVSPSQCRVDCSARAQHLRWLGCDGWPPPGRCRAWEPGHRRCSADEAPAPPADWGPASHPLPLAQQARSYYSV